VLKIQGPCVEITCKQQLMRFHSHQTLLTNSTAVDETKLVNFIHAIVDNNKRQCSWQLAMGTHQKLQCLQGDRSAVNKCGASKQLMMASL
jgi:hypothetical protein